MIRAKRLLILSTSIAFLLFSLLSCGNNDKNHYPVEDDLIVMEYKLLDESEYNEDAFKKRYFVEEKIPLTWLEIADTKEHFDLFAEQGEFAYSDIFDFENNCMIITYGRQIKGLECERSHYFSEMFILTVTFGEEHLGETVFFYQIEKRNYTGHHGIDKRAEDFHDDIAKKIGLNKPPQGTTVYKESDLLFSCLEIMSSDKLLGYAIHDINNDGIPELFILSDDYFIYAIYSIYNDTLVLVGGFWERKDCVIDENGIIYVFETWGFQDGYTASYLLSPDNAELQLIEMVGIDELTAELERFPSTYPDGTTKNIGFDFCRLYS